MCYLSRVDCSPCICRVGVDYTGPFTIKYGSIRKPSLIKAYVCVFVSLSVKAVHLELASDLSTYAFKASLQNDARPCVSLHRHALKLAAT